MCIGCVGFLDRLGHLGTIPFVVASRFMGVAQALGGICAGAAFHGISIAMVGGVQQVKAGNVQLILDVGQRPIQAAPGARPIGALRAKRALLQAQLEHHRPAARLANDGGAPDGGGLGHALGHGGVYRVVGGRGFTAQKDCGNCAYYLLNMHPILMTVWPLLNIRPVRSSTATPGRVLRSRVAMPN